MSNKIHESGEDYLETILILSRQKPEVHAVDVANELNFSKPSVTRALRILRENGYLTIDDRNHIQLTESGRCRAESIYDRHNTIAAFLMLNGVEQAVAYRDACRMEHDVSDETYECMKAKVKAAE